MIFAPCYAFLHAALRLFRRLYVTPICFRLILLLPVYAVDVMLFAAAATLIRHFAPLLLQVNTPSSIRSLID